MTQDIRLTAIEKSLKKILGWLPGFLIICTLMGGAMAAQSLYDNDVAKKKDTDKLSIQMNEISKQVGDLSIRFNAFKVGDSVTKLTIKKSQDSLETVVRNIQRTCKAIGRNVAFVIEVKKHGANGPVTLVPAN